MNAYRQDFDGLPYNMAIVCQPLRWWCRYCGAEFQPNNKSGICNCGRAGHMMNGDDVEFINASLDELNSSSLIKFFRRMWFRWFPAATLAELKRNYAATHMELGENVIAIEPRPRRSVIDGTIYGPPAA